MANENNNQGLLALGMAGLSLLGSTVVGEQNRKWQGRQNQQDRDWEFKMAMLQREWALRDWQSQNEYNDPASQMARLRAAGLSPHLVYGGGVNTTAQSINKVTPQASSKPSAGYNPDMVANAIGVYQTAQLNAAQQDNIRAQTEVAQAQQLLTQANTSKVLTDTARGAFELDQAKALRELVIEQANLANQKTKVDIEATQTGTQVLLNRDAREQLANSTNVELTVNKILESKLTQARMALENAKIPEERAKLVQEIQLLEVQKQNASTEGAIKSLDLALRQKGIMPHDPIYARLLDKWLSQQREATSVSGPMTVDEAIKWLDSTGYAKP